MVSAVICLSAMWHKFDYVTQHHFVGLICLFSTTELSFFLYFSKVIGVSGKDLLKCTN